MVGSFIAATVTAKMYSPVLITFLAITFRLCGRWNLGVWVLCIFASGCVIAFEEDWVRQTPPRGEDCQSSHGKSCFQTMLLGP